MKHRNARVGSSHSHTALYAATVIRNTSPGSCTHRVYYYFRLMGVRRGVIIAYYKGFCCSQTIFGSLDVSFPGRESESEKRNKREIGERENKRLTSIIHD
jgi:hypothetical protein